MHNTYASILKIHKKPQMLPTYKTKHNKKHTTQKTPEMSWEIYV